MANTIEYETKASVSSPFSSPEIQTLQASSPSISSLANSTTCGLAMLIERLFSQSQNSIANKQLVSNLINRLHYNSIKVSAPYGENIEAFILKMVNQAVQCTHTSEANKLPHVVAARLLIMAIKKFEMSMTDLSTLEHEWKEFLFHFYRSRVRSMPC